MQFFILAHNMPLEYEAIRKSFNAIAHQYEENAILQKEVLTRLLERLSDEALIDVDLKPQHILDLACGTGWAHEGIKKLFSEAKISALDFSQNMLNHVDKDIATPVFADAHDLPFADNSVDVVFSNMALHWCNESDVFAESRRVLKPGGLIVMSALGETTLYELKGILSEGDDKPRVHSFPALHDLGDDLLKAGFEDVVVNAEVITLTYKDVVSLMKDIKASGGHNVDEKRSKGLMTSQWLKKIQTAYEDYREDGRIPASYEIVYLRAKKPTAKNGINLTIKS